MQKPICFLETSFKRIRFQNARIWSSLSVCPCHGVVDDEQGVKGAKLGPNKGVKVLGHVRPSGQGLKIMMMRMVMMMMMMVVVMRCESVRECISYFLCFLFVLKHKWLSNM